MSIASSHPTSPPANRRTYETAVVVVSVEAFEALVACVEALVARVEALECAAGESERESPYMTIPEAAAYLRASRQRVDDLLSRGRLRRYKDGSRTLLLRAELQTYLAGS